MLNNTSIIIFGNNINQSLAEKINSLSSIKEVILVGDKVKMNLIHFSSDITVKLVEQKNNNYVYDIFRGISKAKGELLVMINSKFLTSKNIIVNAVNYLNDNKLDFVYCSYSQSLNKSKNNFLQNFNNKLLTFFIHRLSKLDLNDLEPKVWVWTKKINPYNFNLSFLEEVLIDLSVNEDITLKKYAVRSQELSADSKISFLKTISILWHLVKLKSTLWFHNKKSFYFSLGLSVSLLTYLFLSLYNINAPFIHVSADTNGDYGTAAINWVKFGFFKLKFGIHFGLLTDLNNVTFYTHHPSFFVLPTAILYKLFGVSELTTRLGPLSLIFISSLILAFALRKIFSSIWPSLISIFIYGLLPGVIFYGKTFEMAVFSLPTSLITFSLFIFFIFSKRSFYLYLFLISIVIGGFFGWFYYLMVVSLWLFILLTKRGRQIPKRNLLLILIPIISGLTYILNFLHFYILNGSGIFLDMFNQAKFRTSRQPLAGWWHRISWLLKLETTWIFLLTFLGGLGVWFYEQRKNKNLLLLLPILVWPILVFGILFQWSTHPFGVIYTFPVIAVMSGYFLWWIVTKNKIYGLFIMVIVLIGGIYLSWQNQQYFYNKFIILTKPDIELVKQLKDKVDHNQVCLGSNDMGLDFSGIVDWYLNKKTLISSACLENNKYKKQTKFAIIFHPQLSNFYQKEFNKFVKNNFKAVGCTDGYWCLLEKTNK